MNQSYRQFADCITPPTDIVTFSTVIRRKFTRLKGSRMTPLPGLMCCRATLSFDLLTPKVDRFINSCQFAEKLVVHLQSIMLPISITNRQKDG